ncbi:2OG-Fe(II) oxygenase [Mesorhizobium sp.]|uniref:HalD/BesD family halogenase n=1 Tax=Mesorhizobium sp. TaxID=1871066 RepID=UPI0012159815|nr:2OG-Fe(II) oxygenase [Mesorhizobium sp.]TIO08777.1 MAG: 2OG-Fe(II) oxygenase [Mesorhizobium sp.]TIO36296.1 MAG: 2OG-Fe(II) oxygenase [Mesorhizobium sp.]TIP09319.1 MAG: 2OG-Fe(II) oxygenase [Mesorhizobium sp.]
MKDILDLDRYPLDREGSAEWKRLVETSIAALKADGMFNLEGFLRPGVAERAVQEIQPVMATRSHMHKRMHNIYFKPDIPELAPDHPALREVETISHTVCADQIPGSLVLAIYEYEPLLRFLTAAMGKTRLHIMQDPLARTNVMAYRTGEALNWHFDRSEFTTTLLLQAAQRGGDLEYRTDLRSDDNPNYDGVARLLEGRDPEARILRMKPGTLNVFRGKNTAHRVTTVEGERERMIAVFSYYEKPGVMFSDEERVGFYGRAA